MADSNQTTDALIDKIINFINNERELYGDFLIPENPAGQSMETNQKNTFPEISESSDPSIQANSPSQKTDEDTSMDIYQQINQCNTLEELETLCRQTDVLHTDLNGTRLVFGVGNSNADLMLIGEAPGAEEDKQGEPFVGKAGQLLNKILDSIDFSRDDVYIANILKHRPPNNRNPKPEERERSLPFLLHQIDLVNPKLILSLGKVSTQTLLNKNSSLSKMRGQFHNFRGEYELLATYHPAALLRHSKWKRPTWEDIQLLRKHYDELGCRP